MQFNTVQTIKDRLTMREVLEYYGYEPNKKGFICCMFHNEKTPSMKIFEKDYHCFGCGEHGDTITFVQKLFNLSFKEALKKIDIDFGLKGKSNESKERIYINYIDDSVIRAQKSVNIPLLPIKEYQGAPIYQFIGYMNWEETGKIAPKIPNCKITRWYDEGIDIISKDGGKANGIQKVLEFYGMTKEEIIAFGDSDNDMDMLEFAGIGVAMGNAEESVKAVADYVTTDIDEDGIWNACRHLELI